MKGLQHISGYEFNIFIEYKLYEEVKRILIENDETLEEKINELLEDYVVSVKNCTNKNT